MGSYSKKRGVDYTNGKEKMSMEEKRRQWNIDMANRILQNTFDRTEIDESLIINNTKQRRIDYTPQTLYEKAQEYFENIVDANSDGITIIPDVEDFCTFAKISRWRFMGYRKSDDLEMNEVANNIATAIAACKKQSAFAGLINPISFAMDMNNNHDYVQVKTETTINNNVSLQQVEANIADIASRIPVEDIPLLGGGVLNAKED